MKKFRLNQFKKALIGTTLLCSSFFICQAENGLFVKDRLGVVTTVGLSSIQNLTFSNSLVSINKKDASVVNFNRSEVQTIRFGTINALASVKKNSGVSLHQNPVFNELSGDFSLDANESVRIQIVNIEGRIVSDKVVEGLTGKNTFTIPVSSYSNGMYLLRIQSKNSPITTKFIKK